eukprot:jgi/Mesvir1/11191/Mv21696-RA.1
MSNEARLNLLIQQAATMLRRKTLAPHERAILETQLTESRAALADMKKEASSAVKRVPAAQAPSVKREPAVRSVKRELFPATPAPDLSRRPGQTAQVVDEDKVHRILAAIQEAQANGLPSAGLEARLNKALSLLDRGTGEDAPVPPPKRSRAEPPPPPRASVASHAGKAPAARVRYTGPAFAPWSLSPPPLFLNRHKRVPLTYLRGIG